MFGYFLAWFWCCFGMVFDMVSREVFGGWGGAYCLLPIAYWLLPDLRSGTKLGDHIGRVGLSFMKGDRYRNRNSYCLLPIAYCLAYCLLSCLVPIAYCLLPIAYCLLPLAYCLLPIAYCLLPIAYCLLRGGPTALCLPSVPIVPVVPIIPMVPIIPIVPKIPQFSRFCMKKRVSAGTQRT